MVLRVANCSGFLGDRHSAAHEMVHDGQIDVLTGDWLAELTMSILTKQRIRKPDAGFASPFVSQIGEVLRECIDRRITVISNAGGVNPHGCAEAVSALASEMGLELTVAVVDGDDLTERFGDLIAGGWKAQHLDSGKAFPVERLEPTTVNAYIGCWGIVEAIRAGADVVITGRVSDASPIVAAAAAHYGWSPADLDALAGAVAAGHVIECGTQATGGNFSFFRELGRPLHPGFPIAEIARDGSAVITKHDSTAGEVTVETVIAQLLYEIDGPCYANPDVIARFDTLRVEQVGVDRVRISGAFGSAVPDSLKVGIVADYGWASEMTMIITGLDRSTKAAFVQDQLWHEFPDGRETFDDVEVNLIGTEMADPQSLDEATSLLRIAVGSLDRTVVERFSRVVVELVLGGYPGMALTSPPARARQRQLFWPALIPADDVIERVSMRGEQWDVSRTEPMAGRPVDDVAPVVSTSILVAGKTVNAPLGLIAGSRSGDKGGNATLGIWARSEDAYDFLHSWWTIDNVRDLLGVDDATELRIWHLPTLRAMGATVLGWLGAGTATNLQLDTQAKGLGEYVRARFIEIPEALLSGTVGFPS